jgi:NAD(P)-dependent dehydrogenase (short-subunit alcohol dehydrogenase family)
MSDWFKDKVAVITGGAGGIGHAVARQLLHAGSKVAIVDRDRTALNRVVEELASDNDSLIAIPADVSRKEDVERYVAMTVETFGGIDMFHNNAGISGELGPLLDLSVEGFHQVFDVNVLGVLLGMQAVGRVMLGEARGNIVNTGSVTAVRSAKDHALYGATKAAVQRLTQHAAVEWGPSGIRVNAISPGPIETPLFRSSLARPHLTAEEIDRLADQQAANRPLGRGGTPEEAANLVLWLLGPQSSFVTGAIYTIDGGITA